MKKTQQLKENLAALQKEIIYQALSDLCESIEILFSYQKEERYPLHTINLYCNLMEQVLEMAFRFKPKKGNSYHILFTERLNFEHCVSPKKLNHTVYQTMKELYDTLIITQPVNVATLLSRKLYSEGMKKLKSMLIIW